VAATIVVPLDGSELSERALPYARGVAKREGDDVLFVSAVEIPVEFTPVPSATIPLGSEIDDWTTERHKYLEAVAATFPGIRATYKVVIGAPADVVIEAIRELTNPLVVMASHGRSGLSRLFAGSVATRILGEVHCPILLIRAGLPELPAGATAPFAKGLVPLDGSDFGERVLTDGLGAVDASEMALHLIRVIDIPVMTMAAAGDPAGAMNYGLVSEYMDASRAEAEEYLKQLSTKLGADGRAVTWEIRDGDVGHEIVEVAEQQKADVIAMSTHGRGGLGRLVFGSVAEKVLHSAKSPLLLIRPKE
jgi:nucleotide-binding universal stress UspA family protein